MPSIVPGFEYDIFISYRHNDNRSGWVTDFVNALQEELAATIKEPLSIYFDKNPHDGLLETHDVDGSLKDKIKCLIFIPIISQTYCDTKSFAWQHEFCAFNKLAKEDQFGRDIKLSSGNVASRILPIKIHDLDVEDKSLLESELGSILRAIEFIYREAGVNRPLKSGDSKTDNQNKTDYRNQINKTANAIKEIITALKNPKPFSKGTSQDPSPNGPTNSVRKKLVMASLLLAFAITASFVYFKSLDSTSTESVLDKSIAVLPFADMSPAHDQEYFGDGVAEEIINVLAQIPDLKVIARTSSFQFKGKNEDLRKIGETLGVATLLEGSVRKSKDKVRVTAQLIKTSDGSHLWSKTYDRNSDDIFKVQDEIAREVVEALKVTLSGNLKPTGHGTTSDEAYNVYLQARFFFDQVTDEGNARALELFERSIQFDSNFARGWAGLSLVKWRLCGGNAACPDWEQIKELTRHALKLNPNLAEGYLNLSLFARSEFDFITAEKEILRAYDLEPKNSRVLRNYSTILLVSHRFDEAIALCKTGVSLDPVQVNAYRYLGRAYYYSGRMNEALEAFEKAYELSPATTATLGPLEFYNTILFTKGASAMLEKMTTEKTEFIQLAGAAIAQFSYNQISLADQALSKLIAGYANQNAYEIAQVYAFRNDKSNMYKWLKTAYAQKEISIAVLNVDPVFKAFRNESQFEELLSLIKFPE